MAATESDLAARLLERLLSDQAFRAQFRRDPAGACREAGLDGLAQEMSVGGGKAMMTLDIRESKSSLAGVMMAAAMEGMAIYQFTENVLPHLEEVPGQIADVLSRVDLPAVPDFLKKPVSGGGAIATPAEPSGGDGALGDAGAAGASASGAPAAAAAAPPPAAPPAVPETPADGGAAKEKAASALDKASSGKGADAAGGKDAAAAAGKDAAPGGGKDAEPDNSAAQEAAKQIAKDNSPEAAEKAKEDEAAAALDDRQTGLPASSDLPAGGTAPPADAPPAAAPATPAPPVDPAAGAPPAAPPADAPATPAPETPAPPAAPAAELPGAKPADAGAGAVVEPPEAGGGDAVVPPPEAAGGDAVVPPPEAAAGGKTKAKSAAARLADALTGRRGKGADAASPKGDGATAGAADSAGKGAAAAPSDAAAAPAGTSLPTPADTTLPGAGAPADTTLPTAGTPPAADATLPGAAPPADTTLPTTTPDVAEAVVYSAGKPEALALLKNKNVVLDAAGKKELRAGHVDPRLVAVLTKLSSEHKLTVTRFQDGVDIGAIDGEPVSPDSPIAREVASELSQLKKDYRPDEIGSPFQIRGRGYFTDAEHQTSIHVGFKDDLPEDWKPPTDVAATADPPEAAPTTPAVAPPPEAAPVVAAPVTPAPAPAPAVAPAPVAAAAVAEPKPKLDKESQLFLKAVSAKESTAEAKNVRSSDSQLFMKAVEPPKPPVVAQAAAVDPAALAQAIAAPGAYPGDNAPREQIAAWMASEAQRRGLPPELPLMASLVESGMKNLNFGDADSVGFFQMRVGIWNNGPYAGYPEKPELQVKWFLDNAEAVKKQRVAAGKSITDPNQFGDWIADVERPAEQFRGRYQTKLAEAQDLLKNRPAAAPVAAVPAAVDAAAVAPAGGGGSSLGAAALQIAHSQRGVKEIGGANRGAKVEEYLAAAKVAPGNPWCASFITWSLEKAGRKMPGGGWAAVQTWVRNAEQGNNGLKIVSAEDARPGDIVAYDWGGQDDFGSDGHIGFLDSTVQGGKFKALEGNNADAVTSTDRQMGSANIKFIRVEGNASGAAVPPPQGNAVAAVADQAAAPAPASAAPPIDPTQFGGEGSGGPPGAEALALLKNKNIVFDADGIKDIKDGRIDPRVVAVLTKLSGEHKITVTCMCSDHDKFTAGGSVSNHHFGRGMDIGAIDGEIVGPGSPLAREVASELSSLNAEYRPNEIGSPFAIAGPGYFTDAAHQNHLHIGFKQEITADWKPPADVAAAGAPAAAAVPGAPVASAAAVAPAGAPAAAGDAIVSNPGAKRSSQLFLKAVTAKDAAADAAKESRSASGLFQKVDAPKASAAAAPPVAAPAADPAAAPPAVAQAAAVDPAAAVQAVAAAAPDAYPGDSAPREQIAAWMAGQAEKRGLPPQLPLMASLVESGMKNLNFGDADSVGFFQMRVGIWNQGAYAGYPEKPELQVKWFLDQAEAVKRQRLVAGKSITDPNQFGDWIADVERPAAQFRGRYQTKLEEANGLLAQAPAQPAAAPAAAVAAAAPADPAAAAAGAAALGDAKLPAEILAPVEQAIAAGNAPGPKALAAIQEASKYIGTDYKWGGSTPQTGFDCSGLMQWAYAQSGVQIPRVTYTQIEAPNGIEVADKASLKPGDLVFFANQGDVHHVGMFLGGDKFLHAPHTGDVVKVSSLSEPYYASQFAGGRRFDAGAGVAAAPASAPAAAPVASAASAAPAAPAVPAAPAAPAIDPTEVAKAQAAVSRDAAEVRRSNSQLFQAIKAVESSKEREKKVSMMFLKAVDPSQVNRPAEAAAAPVEPAPVAPAPVAAAASLPVEPTPPAPVPDPAPPAVAPTPPPEAAPAKPAADVAPAGKPASAAPVAIDLTNTANAYPGDNASQAELAKWLAKQADAAGLPPELPVMASLVESGVKNLNFGDADSVGFFQMRVGIWNKGAYAGYPEKPELQAKWFIDQALAVKKQRLAAGKSITDPNQFGEWIADIERPAAQYRGRYQLRLGEARKLLK